jgi:hypothetical protein
MLAMVSEVMAMFQAPALDSQGLAHLHGRLNLNNLNEDRAQFRASSQLAGPCTWRCARRDTQNPRTFIVIGRMGAQMSTSAP